MGDDGLHVSFLDTDGSNGETLKLSTGKKRNITIIDMTQLCHRISDNFERNKARLGSVTESVEHHIQVIQRKPTLDQGLDASVDSLDGPWDLIHILRLDDRLQVVLQQLREVVCRLVSTVAGVQLD